MEKLKDLFTFFNLIAKNESAYMRDLFTDYNYFKQFKEWLNNKSIVLRNFNTIDEETFLMIRPSMKIHDASALCHIDLTSDVDYLAHLYEGRLQIVNIPPIGQPIKFSLDTSHLSDMIDYYEIADIFEEKDLSFLDPFPAFITALLDVDKWGGFLVFNDQKEFFYPVHSTYDLYIFQQVINSDEDVFEILDNKRSNSYFLQISDLHLHIKNGKSSNSKGLAQLESSLDSLTPKLKSNYPLKILITGDLMNSPNRTNMYMANDFMNRLKKNYQADVTFVLGNHDVIVNGFNFMRRQKTKVIAYLLGENIKVLENEKIIIIKIDTTSGGNLARGTVGQRQLDEIDDELSAITNLDEYTLFVMLHHHVYPITKAQFLKTKWHEKTFINDILDSTKELIDADLLIDWLNKRHIKYVLHGHKHLPFFRKVGDTYFISGGSSTGALKENRSKYISYNLLKFDSEERAVKVCLIFYDDKTKEDRQRIEVYLLEDD